MIRLRFETDGKIAKIHLISNENGKQKEDDNYTIRFDYSGSGKLIDLTEKDNEIILSSEKQEIDFYVDKTIIPIGREFLRKSEIAYIVKCMDIVAKKEGIYDWRKRYDSDVEDDDSVYIRFEGENDMDYRYQIGVRWSKNTVIMYWYYFILLHMTTKL